MTQLTTADRIGMYVGGGLLLFGVFGIGLLEMLFGATHPVDSEGQIQHDALIDVEIRSYIMLAGLLVMGLVVLYKLVTGPPRRRSAM
jgi:hypothetical protein